MNVVRFKLSGKTAFFKQPDLNSYVYFSYGQIHKAALIGLLGAIMGYGGYNSASLASELKKVGKKAPKPELPEFYKRLNGIKVGIEPLSKNGVFSKKIQVFNNSVGYASQEMGGNLIVKEQWLENVAWNIYILIDDYESRSIANRLKDMECAYVPYLGKNDHPATISNVEVLEAKEIEDKKIVISSLTPKVYIGEIKDNNQVFNMYRYTEQLPICLNEKTRLYELREFIYTNVNVINKSKNVYRVENKNIAFF